MTLARFVFESASDAEAFSGLLDKASIEFPIDATKPNLGFHLVEWDGTAIKTPGYRLAIDYSISIKVA